VSNRSTNPHALYPIDKGTLALYPGYAAIVRLGLLAFQQGNCRRSAFNKLAILASMTY